MNSSYLFFLFIIVINSHFPATESYFSPAPNQPKFLSCDQIPQDIPDPINIDTKDVKFIKTSTLFFIGGLTEKWLINNTGQSVEVLVDGPTVLTVTGGVLYDDVYKLHKYRFYLNLNATTKDHDSSITIDGKVSTRFELRTFWYNLKYGSFDKALNYRDGLLSISNRITMGSISNPIFYPFQCTMKKIKKPGDSAPILSAFGYLWFANYHPDTFYYSFPGSYYDERTGKTYYCTTNIIMEQVPFNFVSYNQFYDTFGHLQDCSRQPLINAESQHPADPRQIVKSKGFGLKNIFL